MNTDPIAIDAVKTDSMKNVYLEKAKRNVFLTKNQLIMHLAKMGKTKQEITGVVELIDWNYEVTAGAELMQERDNQPMVPRQIQIPPPPSQAPQGQVTEG